MVKKIAPPAGLAISKAKAAKAKEEPKPYKVPLTAEEILRPYIEVPFRHARIVDADNALTAMHKFGDQFRKKVRLNIDTCDAVITFIANKPELSPAEQQAFINGAIMMRERIADLLGEPSTTNQISES